MKESERRQIFEEWLGQHKGLIFKIVRAYTRTSADRDDLFQEIVIQVWRSIPSFRKDCTVPTWLYRISLNTAIKWNKNERKHLTVESLDHAQCLLIETLLPVDERLTWLYEEIQRLNEVDRSIVLLLMEGFSYKEMAGIVGVTESNVGVKINRIKKLLITKSKQT